MLKKQTKVLSILLLFSIITSSFNFVLADEIEDELEVDSNINEEIIEEEGLLNNSDETAEISSYSTNTPIIKGSNTTVLQMQNWARAKKANPLFIDLASTFYSVAVSRGIDPALVYVQSALETGYMKFGGVIDASYHNPCGLKNSAGGGDYEGEAHKRFNTWTDGIYAQVDHLALYAGQKGYPKYNKELHDWYISKGLDYNAAQFKKNGTTTDPRQFPYLLGDEKTIEGLGGKWATDKNYGENLKRMMAELYTYPAGPVSNNVRRYSGTDRYETSRAINNAAGINSSIAVISSGQSFPDMLVASTLASQKSANLYMNRPNSVTSELNAAIDSGKIKQVYLVGGNALASVTKNKLTSKNIPITEVIGANRYQTSADVASYMPNKSTVVLTNGEDFPDALSGAPLANEYKYPLLLTNGTTLNPSVNNIVKKANKVIIVGGPASVSTDIENQLKKSGISVSRVSGNNRFETSLNVANSYFGFPHSVLIASGDNFADALSGTVLSKKLTSPIILASGDYLRISHINYLNSRKPTKAYLLGGHSSLSPALEQNISLYIK